MENLNKTYDPKEFEDRIYKEWMDGKYFHAEVDRNKKPYTIMMPPPNVTGNLHMGHALNNTIQDILIRWKRMDGYSALWLPGTDHASISTEAKVVEKIKEDGKSKEELGREGFLEEAWAWTDKYGGNIKNQLKKLGVSCDWDRDRFTLDKMLSNAVEEVFIQLYEKDLIYRGDRIINWCPSCETAISDAEVEHEEQDGHIWTFDYPMEEGGALQIATTRPETIPGDLAVAVNPEDERYRDLIGKHIILPMMNRRIPIIADSYVDMEFGTGAVKITPSHDPNDFEVGERHGLGQCKVMTLDGHMSEEAGPYAGMERYECRKQIIKDFEEKGLLVKVEHHHNAVGHCERCKTTIEPLISKQWFVKMEPLAKPALEAYKNGDLRFVPSRFGKIYTHWLENIKDWCISRQLWWGHRLPVYYCEDCDETIVSKEKIETCSCGHKVVQDPDTLDTWFSSALWPFSTLGWPEETEDYKYFYPTDVLITGYDIIFFWVIRMVFSALEQTGELPFKDVFLTGLVRDELGRKMSKSLGNGIDPLDVIDHYGADALRFTLVTGNSPGNDMRFYMERVEANRNFANKLWNAARFVFMNLEEDTLKDISNYSQFVGEDAWILSKLQKVAKEVHEKFEHYDIGLAAAAIYDFIWSDFCDWYIEMIKGRLYGEDQEDREKAQSVAYYVLKNILKLLHPFMPFITEEIWSHLPMEKGKLIVATWPKYDESLVNEQEEHAIEYVQEAIKGIRNARAESNIVGSKKSSITVYTEDDKIKKILTSNEVHFKNLGYATELDFIDDKSQIQEQSISVVLEKGELFLPMAELVDFKKERERLEKEVEKTKSEIERVNKKLSNQGFISKAPEAIVKKEEEKKIKYEEILKNLEERLSEMPQ
ncbi:MAG: valine--tRNA ligase [Tissierellia bacterium]|nr:valine--tRNA ligase [Tissierellia bacterium]